MFDYETTVTAIELKVRLLADEVAHLREALRQQREQCETLNEALENKEITINNLKEENKLIKLGNRLTEKNDSAEIKIKITQMIRAIDRTLATLKDDTTTLG